jgi:hypothetical protein
MSTALIIVQLLLLLIAIVAGVALGITFAKRYQQAEGFDGSSCDGDAKCKPQLTLVTAIGDGLANGRRDVFDIISKTANMPVEEQCLVNFYALGARFAGYLGPFNSGFYDYKDATLSALKMGCRVMILEIDYWDVPGTCGNYFPRIAVRDSASRNVGASAPTCDSLPASTTFPSTSSIMDVCTVLSQNAFSSAVPNQNDPLIVVLYLLRLPPANAPGDNSAQLTYMSNIASCLAPLKEMILTRSADGGNFTKQQQPGTLLTNNITSYSRQVLVFCNQDTSAFRPPTTPAGTYTAANDLDSLVCLQLNYKLTQLGTTSPSPTTGTPSAILDTADSYNQIPANQVSTIQTSTNCTWTMCFSQDPALPVPQTTTDSIMNKIGVHCVPINIWDASGAYSYMFDKDHFKTHSFIPKPRALRCIKQPIVVPSPQVPQAKTYGGILPTPDGLSTSQFSQ